MTDSVQIPVLSIVIGLIWSGERLLITRRPEGSHLAGYWEFPGGKVKEGEGLREALQRELLEEVGFSVRIGRAYSPIPHTYHERTVRIYPFDCYPYGDCSIPSTQLSWRWITLSELAGHRFPPANASLIELLT